VGAWYREWFEEHYLDLYEHRDPQEAEVFVTTLLDRLDPPAGGRVLDVACGAGRHAHALAGRGFQVVGIDLSRCILERAAADTPPEPARGRTLFVQGDMRCLPVRPRGWADLVLNLFTSFGYFPTEEEDARTLAGMAGALRPEGILVLDFLNRSQVLASLVECDEQQRDGLTILQERRLTDRKRRIEKRITLHHPDGRRSSFRESVRLYAPEELCRLLREAGLSRVELWGDYTGTPLQPESPRCIALAARPT
jgi:SAM-dependent methyltransferase